MSEGTPMMIMPSPSGGQIEYLAFGEEFITYSPSATTDGLFDIAKRLSEDIAAYKENGWFLRSVITVRVGIEGDAILAFFANGNPPMIVARTDND